MGLCEKVLDNVGLNITFISVHATFAIPHSVLLKDDGAFLLGVSLLSGHFYGDFRAKQEYGVRPISGEILSKCERKQCKSSLIDIKSHKYRELAPRNRLDNNSIPLLCHSCDFSDISRYVSCSFLHLSFSC
jgi:hypothetical protein